MIIELEISGARVIVSGDNLTVSVTEMEAPVRRVSPRVPNTADATSEPTYEGTKPVMVAGIPMKRGTLSRLARALDLTPQAISQWEVVPAERMGDVSRFTGIPLQELRPDIFAAAECAA